ncbi:MAG: threonine/serine dehydratase [Ktedonobacterales bacterium]
MEHGQLVGLDEIMAAQQVIAGHLHHTPLVSAHALGERIGGVELRFKAELLQKTGSFKPRGALNKLSGLTDEEKAAGVITISAGNHAQGVAFAALLLGIPATVVMPEAAVQSKVDATRGYGATVVLHGTVQDLLPKCRQLQQERNLTFVHPFDDPLVIAGQGTLGLEILQDGGSPDVVVVPVGGGGLISGVAAALKSSDPKIQVIGVEPVGASVMIPSLRQNVAMHLEKSETIADGLAAPFVGELNLAHVQHYVDGMVLVTDEEIIAAMRLIMERCKFMVEPSGAASFAALLAGKINLAPNAKVVSILSGGNIDRGRLKEIL